MDDEFELVMSPLCGKISRDGMTIEVSISRGLDDDEWVLEVFDQELGATVWDNLFPTDQAAYDEVVRTIDNEGIATFLRDPAQNLN